MDQKGLGRKNETNARWEGCRGDIVDQLGKWGPRSVQLNAKTGTFSIGGRSQGLTRRALGVNGDHKRLNSSAWRGGKKVVVEVLYPG